jgi:hypothetical protein
MDEGKSISKQIAAHISIILGKEVEYPISVARESELKDRVPT